MALRLFTVSVARPYSLCGRAADLAAEEVAREFAFLC